MDGVGYRAGAFAAVFVAVVLLLSGVDGVRDGQGWAPACELLTGTGAATLARWLWRRPDVLAATARRRRQPPRKAAPGAGKVRRCGHCRRPGHNRTTCPDLRD
ncbi:hypothetical protein [Arsenicicoccus dermatophilus]|uniref:hypothetical protein n=1 Tax=Arsenicicoccus dermatophilus TaxID=1076331 RepID=UPI0039175946